MIPFSNSTVTLIRRIEQIENGRTKVSYKRHVLTGCSWRMKNAWQHAGAEMQRGTEITCRIPPGSIAPQTGDYLFLGNVRPDTSSTETLNAALENRRTAGAMRIASVGDHTIAGNPIPHFAARGNSP